MKTLSDLIDFLDTLTEKKLAFHLDKIRDSILIEITLPGQMWEIEFMQDGTVEIEKFIRSGEELDKAGLFNLIREFAEPGEAVSDLNADGKDVWVILKALDQAKIYYTLERGMEHESLSAAAAVPGQRWHIAVLSDGHIAAEQYLSTLEILDERELDSLFEAFS